MLLELGEYAEAKAVCRRSLGKLRRVFGRDHSDTPLLDPTATANLAASFSEQGKYAEAAKIESEILVSTTACSAQSTRRR